MAEESLTFKAFGVDVSGGPMLEHLGDKADDAGDSIRGLGDDSKSLDTRLDETRTHLRALIADFDRTGDTSLFRDIRKDRSTISMIESMRKEINGLGDDTDQVGPRISKNVSKSLTETLGALPSQLKGAGIAALVGIGAAAAPALGAAVAGAVVGGIGLGGIVGGVALAVQDGRIHDAFLTLGSRLGDALKESGRPFFGPLLSEIDDIAIAGYKGINILHDGFVKLAPTLRPLVQGISGLIDNLGPGFANVFTAAQPAIRALANELPEIGAAISDMLTSIASSDDATQGLIGLLDTTEMLLVATGDFIHILETEYGWLVDIGAELDKWKDNPLTTFFGGVFESLTTEATNVKKGLVAANDASKDFNRNLGGTADTAEEAAAKIKDFADAIDELFGKQMTWDQAQIALRDGMRDLVKELTTGKRTLKENSEEGDKNRKAILDQIGAVEHLRDAYYRQTGSLDGANKMYDANLERLRVTLLRLGYNKDAVDDLINAYKGIPAKAATTVEAPGLANVQSRLNSVANTLARLDGETTYHRFVTIYDSQYRAGERNPTGRAAGGPVFAGQTYWVGEHGPELVTFGRDGRVIPAAQSAAMTGGSSGSVNVLVSAKPGSMQALADIIIPLIQFEVSNAGAGDVEYLSGRS